MTKTGKSRGRAVLRHQRFGVAGPQIASMWPCASIVAQNAIQLVSALTDNPGANCPDPKS